VAFRLRVKQSNATCGDGNYCVKVHSRRASLVSEFCLDKRENDVPNIEAAERLLRRTMGPHDFAETIVTLTDGEGSSNESILQFDPTQK